MADNDLDRMIGALITPKEAERILGREAKRLLFDARVQNMNPPKARGHIETSLRTMIDERGLVRFGANKTVGKIVGKVMSGYESGYNRVQPLIEKEEKRFNNRSRRERKFTYWGTLAQEDFLREYWAANER